MMNERYKQETATDAFLQGRTNLLDTASPLSWRQNHAKWLSSIRFFCIFIVKHEMSAN